MRTARPLVAVCLVCLMLLAAVSGGAVAQSAPPGGGSGAGAGGGVPQAGGEPQLDVHVPSPTLTPGQTNQVSLQISNDGELDFGPPSLREAVTTARNVRVSADADGTPLTVESGETAIGAVTESRPGEVPIAVNVPAETDAGTYTVDIRVAYSHTYRTGPRVQERERVRTVSVDLEVNDNARFAVVNTSTDARIGDTGTLAVEVENVGGESARNANVILESSSVGLGFGDSATDAARIESLAPGETTAVRYDIGFAPDAPVRKYALDIRVAYRTPNGLQRIDTTPTTSVTPGPQQQFSVTDVTSALYVGEDGEIRGTVTNEGPVTAENVVVRYTDQSPNVIPIETAVSVGTLAAGESSQFRLPVEISGEAAAINRTADIAIQYRNSENAVRLYEDVDLAFAVAPDREQFIIDIQQQTITAGESMTVTANVTNNLDEPVTDVEARLFADSPLSSSDDEAFAEQLAPGESTTMTFTLSAAAGTTAKTYPISFDFRFTDAEGDSQLSDTIRVPTEVTTSDESLPLVPIGGALIVLVIVGGGIYYARAS